MADVLLTTGPLVAQPFATLYRAVGVAGSGAGDEVSRQITYRTAGMLKQLYVNVPANTATANSTVRVRKNGANGNQLVTIPSATTGVFEDNVNTDAVAAGDEVAYETVRGGTG